MSRNVFRALVVTGAMLASQTAHAQDTIRVGWTIPAEEAKYWIMRRPDQFPNLGKTYKIEFTQFQGTAPMVQAMVAGALDCSTQAPLSLANGALQGGLQAYIIAQHVGERPGSFSVYWAVKDDSPIKTVADMKGKSVGTNVFGSGILGPMFLLLKKNGLDPQNDIKLVETGFPVPRTPSAPAAWTSAYSISRSRRARRPRAACASCSRSQISRPTSCTSWRCAGRISSTRIRSW